MIPGAEISGVGLYVRCFSALLEPSNSFSPIVALCGLTSSLTPELESLYIC